MPIQEGENPIFRKEMRSELFGTGTLFVRIIFQIAIFGINGPISVAPVNFIFFREAKVEFYR